MNESKSEISYSLPSNLSDANGLYISTGANVNIFLPYRPYFVNTISEDINFNWDNVDYTVYQRFWDVYLLQCILSESEAKDLTKIRAAKDLTITYYDYGNVLNADTTNREFTVINVTQIQGTALLQLDIQFRVSAFIVDNTTPENQNYQLMLTNKSVRTGLFSNPDASFYSAFGYAKSFYTAFYPILDEETPTTDNISIDFVDYATRTTAKKQIKLLFFLNESDKNIVKRYATLCNASVFIDKTKSPVSIGNVQSDTDPFKLVGTGFLSLVPYMTIFVGVNSYQIVSITSDTLLTIDVSANIPTPTAATTYKYYILQGISIPEINQTAKNLYDVNFIGMFEFETIYNL